MFEDLAGMIARTRVAFPRPGSGVSEFAIQSAERRLGLSLPPSFRWWLREYGGGQIGGDILYGLDEAGIDAPDIVELARRNRADGRDPSRLVVCIGNEEEYWLATSATQPDEECPVWLADGGHVSLYASSFAEFLRRRLRDFDSA